MYVEAKSGMGDDYVAWPPAGVRVVYGRDGSVLYVDQVHQTGALPGVTTQQLQTMSGRVALIGGLIMLAALGGPAALVSRFVLGWAWTKSLLVGAGVGVAGAAWWDWRVTEAAKQAAQLNPTVATTAAPASPPAALATPVTATAPAPVTATAPSSTPVGDAAAPSTFTAQPAAAVPGVTYKGVNITLVPPPALPPVPPNLQPMLKQVPLWQAIFVLPSATSSQSVEAPDPAGALAAAQSTIDAALAAPAPSVAASHPVAVIDPIAAVSAASPSPPASPSMIFPISYKGVTVSFAIEGGMIVGRFSLPGSGPQSATPQPTYAAAITASKAAIDAGLKSEPAAATPPAGPSPF